jgi:hypothetical protein
VSAPEVRRPWVPACLAKEFTADDVGGLVYVVVDEMVGDHVGLTINPWPYADADGRLRFPDRDQAFELALSKEDLAEQLYQPLGLERSPRVGDVFALRLSERGRDLLARGEDVHWRDPVRELMVGRIYDISHEARKVAKLALYAMAAVPLSRAEAKEWLVLEMADTKVRRAPSTELRESPAEASGAGPGEGPR